MIRIPEITTRIGELRMVTSAVAKTMPMVFGPIALIRESNKRRRVRPSTDLVIEGFWRCGNHFATYAFLLSQPGRLEVAHHFHAPGQFALAAKWRVPAMLLIREPEAAIASAAVFLGSDNPRPFIRFYNIFHRAVMQYVDAIVVSRFDQTVGDFGAVVHRVNQRFGTTFNCVSATECDVRRVQEVIVDEHRINMKGDPTKFPLPSVRKQQLKEDIVARLNERHCRDAMSRAKELYATLAGYANYG